MGFIFLPAWQWKRSDTPPEPDGPPPEQPPPPREPWPFTGGSLTSNSGPENFRNAPAAATRRVLKPRSVKKARTNTKSPIFLPVVDGYPSPQSSDYVTASPRSVTPEMSLFGNQNNATSSAPSLFAGLNTPSSQQQQQTPSLFGSATANNQSSTGSSLFGAKPAPLNIGAAQQASTPSGGSGLFGSNNSTTQAGGSGLFGASNPSTSGTGTGSGLFGLGQLGSSSQAQTSSPFAPKSAGTGSTSLFGQAASTQPTTNSLFSRISGVPQQPASPLGQPATTQPTTNSLFSRISGVAQQPAAPFGQASSQPAQSTSLFGQTSTQQPQSSSLFGQTTAQQPQSTSLFGQTSTQQPLNTSLFGQASTQQPQGNSLFGQTNNTLVQAQNAVSNGTTAVGPAADAPKPAFFEDLLERGRKRRDASSMESVQAGQLPSLQLSLGDISSKIRGLGSASKPDFGASRAHDTRAHYLLAASGISQNATRRDLDDFAAQSTVASQQAGSSFEPDSSSYLDKMYAKTTMEALAESVEQSKRDFELFIEENIDFDLVEQRRRVYEHFGLVKPQENGQAANNGASVGPAQRGAFGKSSRRARGLDASGAFGKQSAFGRSSAARSILGSSKNRPTLRQQPMFPDVTEKSAGTEQNSALSDPYLRDKQDRYIAQVRELNIQRIEGLCYPVARAFEEVESRGVNTPQHLKNAYKALVEIVEEPGQILRPSDPGAIKERQFAKEYLDESNNTGAGLSIRRRILAGSRRFLENEFYQKIEVEVSTHAREADVGGIPTKISKVRGYVRIRANRKNLGADANLLQKIGDDYVWVLIFHLLRCGLTKEAAQYVVENETAINAMDRHFSSYVQLFAKHDRNIPLKERMSMNRTYQQRTLQPENSVDPYRMACYKIMGRCELSRKNIEGINQNIDDLIWLYFALARETNRAEETAGEVFGLEDVQNLMEDIGERHFSSSADASSGYPVYFLMQVLSGMFEKAVGWLYRFNYIAAIHFAIALDYYGLLRVADFSVSEENLVSYTTRDKAQISFGRLLGYYTSDFRNAKSDAAADYLVLVCLNKDLPGESGIAHSRMCHEALKELVLETRDFALLLGDVCADGSRLPGAIQQRLPLFAGDGMDQNEYLRNLTIQAAATADDNGRTTDAVLLYHLADDLESVISIVNRALSDALSVEIGDEQLQLQPLKPRAADQAAAHLRGSLSLGSITDPADLARSMVMLYDNDGMALQKIQRETMDTAHVLLQMAQVKNQIMQSRWAEALDAARELDFLPFNAMGNVSTVRLAAQSLNNKPQAITRNIGPLLVWSITACGQQRRILQNSAFEGTRNSLIEQLALCARDMMVYAGLIRYKLSSETFEMLAQAGQNVGMN